ncbi:MAB_1171c family putative transporter [Nocardia sp. Marseille-Q1738]
MSAPAPLWIALPLVVLICVVTVARWLLVDQTVADRFVNRAMSWQAVGMVVYEVGEVSRYADLTYRVFLGCGVLVLFHVVGIAALFDGADTGAVQRRQRILDVVAAIGGVFVAVIGRPVDFGWQVIVFTAIFQTPMAAAGLLTVRASVRELRGGELSLRERAVIVALLLTAASWCGFAFASGLQVIGGKMPNNPGQEWTIGSWVVTLSVTALVAVPLIGTLLRKWGWDRTGREIRQLQPLWRDLTTAVPEVALHQDAAGSRGPESRLYRMIVEIQDALLQLRQFLPAHGTPDSRMAEVALEVARAVQARTLGITVRPEVAPDRPHQAVHDFTSQLDRLLILAREWPGARSEVSKTSPTVVSE